jgi:hypothetical protein
MRRKVDAQHGVIKLSVTVGVHDEGLRQDALDFVGRDAKPAADASERLSIKALFSFTDSASPYSFCRNNCHCFSLPSVD